MERNQRLSTSNWRSPVSDRLERFPDKPYPSPGFGMIPFKGTEKTAVEYFMSVMRVRDMIVAGRPQSDRTECHADLKRVAYIFDVTQAAHRPGWFVQAQTIGNPSHVLARAVTETLTAAQAAITNRDEAALRNALDFLHDEAVTEMLENYITLAKGGSQPDEDGFAYLAWTADHRPEITVGASSGNMAAILADLGSRSGIGGRRTWGVLGAWLVHDPEMAQAHIDRMFELKGTGIRGSTAYLHERAKEGIKEIEAMLISTDNLILSPWHVDDEAAFGRLGIVKSKRRGEVVPSRLVAI